MDFEDRITIPTPEGVSLELTLAGLGSRALSGMLDLMLKACMVAVLALILFLGLDENLAVAVLVPAVALVLLGYDILFELRGSGRTPGKRAAGLRVVRSSGRPIDPTASFVRNLLRLVDGLTLMYVPTMVCILATRRNQRLGDLAADTVVVRDRVVREQAQFVRGPQAPQWAGPPGASASGGDTSGVGADEVATVRSFLERRAELQPEARARLAAQLADALRPRVAGIYEPDPERFLEALYADRYHREGGGRP